MALQVIEGTWEEIERRKAELIGRQLRVIIKPEKSPQRKPSASAQTPVQPKKLVGYGAFRDALPSTEQFMREKQEEIAREERDW